MSATIFKYEIPITDGLIKLELDEFFVLYDIQNKEDKIYMWCSHVHDNPKKDRYFEIFGTGQIIKNYQNYRFLKTVHMSNGLVFHIFQLMII